MPLTADRCQETTTTTGTGTVTLLGAVAQYQAFATAFAVGAVIEYAIQGQTGSEWEVGWGTLASSSTLSRDTVFSSSNGNAAVTLSAGTKNVFATISASSLGSHAVGSQLAQSRGWALP